MGSVIPKWAYQTVIGIRQNVKDTRNISFAKFFFDIYVVKELFQTFFIFHLFKCRISNFLNVKFEISLACVQLLRISLFHIVSGFPLYACMIC